MRVVISPEAAAEIAYYVGKSSVEISGLGRVLRHDDVMEVTKIYLLKQENSAAATDLDAEAVADLMYQSREDAHLGSLNFWWHSHVDMPVFWSGTDMATIEQFGKNGFLLATVFNKSGARRSALQTSGTDFIPPIFMDDLPTTTEFLPPEPEYKRWESEFKEKAKEKPPIYNRFTGGVNSWLNQTHIVRGANLRVPDDVPTAHMHDDFDWDNPMNPMRGDKTLLATDMHSEVEYEQFILDYAGSVDALDWYRLAAMACDVGYDLVSAKQVWETYEEWDGDLDLCEAFYAERADREAKQLVVPLPKVKVKRPVHKSKLRNKLRASKGAK